MSLRISAITIQRVHKLRDAIAEIEFLLGTSLADINNHARLERSNADPVYDVRCEGIIGLGVCFEDTGGNDITVWVWTCYPNVE